MLTSPRAERVRRVAALARRSARKKEGKFLAEGPQPVREALRAWLRLWDPEMRDLERGPAVPSDELPTLDALYFDSEALSRHPEVEALVDQVRGVLFDPQSELPRSGRLFLREATVEVLAAMGDAETSQGVVAVCRVPAPRDGDSLARVLARRPTPYLGVGLLGVQDPGNVGTIIRAADAAGADAVIQSPGTADPWAPKVVRSAAGSHFHLPILTGVAPNELAARARREGHRLLGADGSGEVDLPELAAPADSTVWLMGNEARGLSAEEKVLADQRVSIPLYGRAESLNVAMAATICLYSSATAQHRARNRAQDPDQP